MEPSYIRSIVSYSFTLLIIWTFVRVDGTSFRLNLSYFSRVKRITSPPTTYFRETFSHVSELYAEGTTVSLSHAVLDL